MRWAWFILAVVVLVLVVVGGLYAAEPKYVGKYRCVEWETVGTPSGPWGSGTQTNCVRSERRDRANAWERISGAISG